jgi:hypothetical protein
MQFHGAHRFICLRDKIPQCLRIASWSTIDSACVLLIVDFI